VRTLFATKGEQTMKNTKMSRRTHSTTGMREMNRELQNEMLRTDLEQLEQQRIQHDVNRRKFAEATNTRDVPRGWVDTRH
jgi:hypothetical protein